MGFSQEFSVYETKMLSSATVSDHVTVRPSHTKTQRILRFYYIFDDSYPVLNSQEKRILIHPMYSSGGKQSFKGMKFG